MAQRRMVSVKIIDSGKFIKMPVSTQALYFHLIARADDDGIVEAFNVMRMTGASEDDLKVLCAKEFVKVLNDDLVAFITDWHEHNLIRADRKIDSMYQHLLLQVVPEVELKEKKERADRRKLLSDDTGTSQGQPKDSIGEVRLGKGSSEKRKYTVDEETIKDIRSVLPSEMTKDKATALKRIPIILRDYSADNIKKSIRLYAEEVTKQRKSGFKDLKYVNECKFWNSRYMTYIDEEEMQKPVAELVWVNRGEADA